MGKYGQYKTDEYGGGYYYNDKYDQQQQEQDKKIKEKVKTSSLPEQKHGLTAITVQANDEEI